MMSPLKLSVIVCGAAAGLAVAPYVVKQILPPESTGNVVASAPQQSAPETLPVKIDLPVAGQNQAPVVTQPAALASPVKEEAPVQAELKLETPATLPVPEKAQPELSLPSLSNPVVANAALPTPAPTQAPPKPSPTPEIPYSADVESAQKFMKQLGFSTGKIDGKLGPNTQAAVKEFQKKEGLETTGQVDADLVSRMEKAVAALPTPTPVPTPEPESKVVITDADNKADDVKADDMEISKADDPDTLVVRKADVSADEQKNGKAANESSKEKVVAKAAAPKVDPGPVPSLKTMDDVRKIQDQLKVVGTYNGDVDGKWGDLTRAAMREFQEKAGIEVTGKPNKETWIAMHSEKNAAGASANDSRSESDSESSSQEISTDTESDEVLVTVNGDGTSNPGAPEPLATPKAISSLKAGDDKKSDKKSEKPTVQVSTPVKKQEKSNDLAVAKEDRESQAAELEKEIKATRARIQSVGNDKTYEVKKYAPKMLETVNNMADGLSLDSSDDDMDETRQRIARISEELEKAKRESGKKKAETIVKDVRESYSALKDSFPQRIKTLSLSDDEEKEQREKLTDFVADIDKGYDAMESDFKKGKYEPIFENGVAFQSTINEINRGLAEIYVREKLNDKSVKSKLEKSELKDIEALIDKSEHVKAADKLDKLVSSESKKKS